MKIEATAKTGLPAEFSSAKLQGGKKVPTKINFPKYDVGIHFLYKKPQIVAFFR